MGCKILHVRVIIYIVLVFVSIKAGLWLEWLEKGEVKHGCVQIDVQYWPQTCDWCGETSRSIVVQVENEARY